MRIYNFDAASECDRSEQRAFPEATKVKNDHSIWWRRKNPFRCDAKSVMDIHELRGEGKLRASACACSAGGWGAF